MRQNFVPCIALVEFHGDAGYVKDALFKAVKNGAPTNNFRVHTYHDMDSFINDLRKGNQKFHGVVFPHVSKQWLKGSLPVSCNTS